MSKEEIEKLVKSLNSRNWVDELLVVGTIHRELNEPTVRDLAEVIGKSKSWAADSLYILRGFKLYPELMREPTRLAALRKFRFRVKMNKRLS